MEHLLDPTKSARDGKEEAGIGKAPPWSESLPEARTLWPEHLGIFYRTKWSRRRRAAVGSL
jgi:hypothetical protein